MCRPPVLNQVYWFNDMFFLLLLPHFIIFISWSKVAFQEGSESGIQWGVGGTPFCKENSFIDTARDVGSQESGCKPMLADVMNRKWRVSLLKKTPTEGWREGQEKGWGIRREGGWAYRGRSRVSTAEEVQVWPTWISLFWFSSFSFSIIAVFEYNLLLISWLLGFCYRWSLSHFLEFCLGMNCLCCNFPIKCLNHARVFV